jgi:hypothetical protein
MSDHFLSARRFHLVFRLCLLAMVFSLPPGAAAALAQNVNGTASLSEQSAEVGQTLEYRIEITGASGVSAPQVPQVDGLTITDAGQQQMQNFSGGFSGLRMTITQIFLYSVEPQRAGRFTIPGQEVQTRNGTVRIAPVAFTVAGQGGAAGSAAGRTDPGRAVFAELSIPKKSAYVGESFAAEAKVYFGLNVRFEIDPNPILSGEGFTAQKFVTPQQSERQAVEGVEFQAVTFKTSIAGAKTGHLTIGPVEMTPLVQMPRSAPRRRPNYSDPFDDPFFRDPFQAFGGGGSVTKQMKLRSDPVDIEIKPLPPGAPPDFSGAIGQFSLDAEVQPHRAQAGDPVTVRLRLKGQGNFDRIGAPKLTDEKNLRAYPPSAKFKADDDIGLYGTKNFEQVIVAQSGRTSLPGYRFSYFDPVAVRYVALETPPLPVIIEGDAAPTPTPAPSPAVAAADATPTPAPPKPKPPQDILYIRSDLGRPVGSDAFLPLYRQRSFWLMQIAPLMALLAAGMWGLLRARARNEVARRAAEIQRQQAQLVKALRSERTGRRDFYSAATRLAQLRAAAAAGQPGAYLSASEVCEAKHLDPGAAASVEEIFQRHDELAYSGETAAQEPVPSAERNGVLATLETFEKR